VVNFRIGFKRVGAGRVGLMGSDLGGIVAWSSTVVGSGETELELLGGSCLGRVSAAAELRLSISGLGGDDVAPLMGFSASTCTPPSPPIDPRLPTSVISVPSFTATNPSFLPFSPSRRTTRSCQQSLENMMIPAGAVILHTPWTPSNSPIADNVIKSIMTTMNRTVPNTPPQGSTNESFGLTLGGLSTLGILDRKIPHRRSGNRTTIAATVGNANHAEYCKNEIPKAEVKTRFVGFDDTSKADTRLEA